eukprot:CAMPEP_0177642526 /NCGR_PEP_ID=MMETSP0447-20121125/7633_1 /TAXON_ID=0 /ORGANISM="Stygamoeba regulata, Strain BSH-02190019" /LENGTH=146 /DNA_ID=CAMNT_0019144689 /DNA_START=62 /DNA_END=502 /DNA_ORIENTATION=-
MKRMTPTAWAAADFAGAPTAACRLRTQRCGERLRARVAARSPRAVVPQGATAAQGGSPATQPERVRGPVSHPDVAGKGTLAGGARQCACLLDSFRNVLRDVHTRLQKQWQDVHHACTAGTHLLSKPVQLLFQRDVAALQRTPPNSE